MSDDRGNSKPAIMVESDKTGDSDDQQAMLPVHNGTSVHNANTLTGLTLQIISFSNHVTAGSVQCPVLVHVLSYIQILDLAMA